MAMTYLHLRQRASKGARFLDKHTPDWFRRIELPTLDLADETSCVLGQVLGDYFGALNRFADEGIVKSHKNWLGEVELVDIHWADKHGFDDSHDLYEPLGAAWQDEIRARRRAHPGGTRSRARRNLATPTLV